MANKTTLRAGWFWDSRIADIYCQAMPCDFTNNKTELPQLKTGAKFPGFIRVDN